ncbi:MAG TPA: hypothetical protein VF824_17140 [Thermoanaerobaculia bacterium]|jgi:hypothetical protein
MNRFVTTVVLCLLVPVMGLAQGTCDTQTAVKEYLLAKSKGHPMRVAVYDHRTKEWLAFEWNGSEPTRSDDSIEVSPNNEPTLYVPRGEQVAVLVVNTNPLLYTSEVTKVEQADIEGLAALQKIAGLGGSLVPKVIPGITHTVAAAAAPQTTARHPSGTTPAPRITSIDRLGRLELDNLVTAFLDALRPHNDTLGKAVQAAKQRVGAAKTLVGKTEANRTTIIDLLQLADLGTSGTLSPYVLTDLKNLTASTQASFAQAALDVKTLEGTDVICGDSISALDTLLRVTLLGSDADEDDEKALAAAKRALASDSIAHDCTAADVAAPLTKLAQWIIANPHAAGDVWMTESLKTARTATRNYLDAAEQRDTVLASAEKLLEKRGAALMRAAEMERFGTLYSSSEIAGSNCWLTHGVIEVQRVEKNQLAKLPWFRVQTEEFNLMLRPTFKDDLSLLRSGDVSGKYTLSRGDYGIGVDTALIYTHANDREYKGLPAATKAAADDPAKELFVNETSRTDRTGKLALMLNVSPRWARGFGAQVGFGMDTDNPSAFIGFSHTIGKFARISAGHTQQRVTRLANGVTLGATTPEEVSTRERFDASWYAALAFTISELPIFGGGDDK